MVKTLDDTKQWAALHYAVFNNNRFVCEKLTGTKLFDEDSHEKQSDDKYFLCGMFVFFYRKLFCQPFLKMLILSRAMEKMFYTLLLDQVPFGKYAYISQFFLLLFTY